jgi:hypothetical protein
VREQGWIGSVDLPFRPDVEREQFRAVDPRDTVRGCAEDKHE